LHQKKLDEMGHLHFLPDKMGLDKMGLDEMGINRSQAPTAWDQGYMNLHKIN